MKYVFLQIKTFHSKDNKELNILYVLDMKNLVVQTIYITQNQVTLLKDFHMFDDFSDLVVFRYNPLKNSYQLALC